MSRRLVLSALACGAMAQFAGCATTDSAPANLQALASRDAQLSTFVKLTQQAGLGDLLTGATPVTVFAPSDEAFRAVPAATLDKLAKDPEALKALLKHHAVAGVTTRASLTADTITVTTLAGTKLVLSKAGEFITVEDALVTQPDGTASNGVLHVIDRVLTPPKK
ncbi:MAG: hypothetical protein A2711_00895 [Burkholderiales bacterium RIFCSPHIGHO2_01_FULL_63_240]|nr:MAG: hypothetical protein A2711_00895 [Burkholderiales bacterium RIFCSPHIGHO2_01_FULL_63_240]